MSESRSCRCGCGAPVARTYAKGHGRRRPIAERLLRKLDRSSAECWTWTGAVSTSGYGVIGVSSTATDYVHRAAYRAWVGPIPAGRHIDHLCRNRLCANPAHLEAVTQAENNRRAALARWGGAS